MSTLYMDDLSDNPTGHDSTVSHGGADDDKTNNSAKESEGKLSQNYDSVRSQIMTVNWQYKHNNIIRYHSFLNPSWRTFHSTSYDICICS